jgi:hypothetical protein
MRVRAFAFGLVAVLLGAAPGAAQEHALSPVAAALPPPSGEPAGLLLGLRQGDDYATLFFMVEDGAVAVRRYPWLVSPQADGFRYLDGATASLGPGCPGRDCRFHLTDVWVGPSPARGEGFAGFLEGEIEAFRMDAQADPMGDRFTYRMIRRIEWVANGAACLSIDIHRYRGGAHGFMNQAESCLPIDPAENSWDMSEPLPIEASGLDRATLSAAANQLVADIHAGRFEEGRFGPDDAAHVAEQNMESVAFRLERAHGRTMAVMIGYVPVPYALSPSYRLTVTAPMGPVGEPLAPYNPPLPFYDRLTAIDAGVRDAFLSPTGNALFVMLGDTLVGLEPGSGRVLVRHKLAADAVVAADWAVGNHMERWAETVAAP